MLQNTPVDLDLHVTLLGKELCLVVSVKDLGVHMDARMSVDEHITSITSSCLSSLSQMNRVKHLLDRNTLFNVINALVFSKFYYCSSDSGLVRQRRISAPFNKLQDAQNLLRAVTQSVAPLWKASKLSFQVYSVVLVDWRITS